MGENKENNSGVMEHLALITDGLQSLFPDGKTAVIVELKYKDFKKIQKNFRDVDSQYDQFKIDISGTEIIFVLENTLVKNEPKKEEPVKKGFWGKLFSIKGGKSSIKN